MPTSSRSERCGLKQGQEAVLRCRRTPATTRLHGMQHPKAIRLYPFTKVSPAQCVPTVQKQTIRPGSFHWLPRPVSDVDREL